MTAWKPHTSPRTLSATSLSLSHSNRRIGIKTNSFISKNRPIELPSHALRGTQSSYLLPKNVIIVSPIIPICTALFANNNKHIRTEVGVVLSFFSQKPCLQRNLMRSRVKTHRERNNRRNWTRCVTRLWSVTQTLRATSTLCGIASLYSTYVCAAVSV